MKTVCIAYGDGCPRTKMDVALLFDYFAANGWATTNDMASADLVVVSGCGVNGTAEERSFARLKTADDKRAPGSRMIVVGCIAGISRERLGSSFDATAIAPRDIALLDDVIGASVPLADVADPNEIEPRVDFATQSFDYEDRRPGESVLALLARRGFARTGLRRWLADHGRMTVEDYVRPEAGLFSIRVGRGCDGECTYCGIREACGPMRSKPLASIVQEFDHGLATGHTAFRLIAQDLGGYGQDIGSDVVQLLSALFSRPGDYVVRLIDFDPRWLVRYHDELVPLFAANVRRVRHLAIPMQSGSDRILRLMRRGNTAEEAAFVYTSLRREAPDLELSTHVLVGFPGETDEDFDRTLALLRTVAFDRVDVYPYTDRPGTPASRMQPKVPQHVIDTRARRIAREFPSELELARRSHHAGRRPDAAAAE